MKRLLDYDPVMGLKTYFEPDGDKFKIGYEQDVARNLEYSKRLQNDPNYKRAGIKNEMYHFAHVPAVVLMEWKTKYGIDWTKKEHLPRIEKLLSGPEYKYLRTVNKI